MVIYKNKKKYFKIEKKTINKCTVSYLSPTLLSYNVLFLTLLLGLNQIQMGLLNAWNNEPWA